MTDYEKGEWDMFNLITSVSYGKQRFFIDKRQKTPIVFDRLDGAYLSIYKAYEKYIEEIGEY